VTGRRASDGSATIATLGGVSVIVVGTVVAVALGFGTEVRHRAQAAADAAALAAAADAIAGQAAACERARQFADRNGARLQSCAVHDAIADLTVGIDLPGMLRPLGPVVARARAGPASIGTASSG
jgi:secretion/DNA translocation related TadE-like protein